MANPRRPRILHVIQEDGPGGAPKTVLQQLKYFRHRAQLMVAHGGHGRIAETCDEHGIPHRQMPLERPGRWMAGLPWLTLWLVKNRPDLLVLHGQWGGVVGAIAAACAHVPNVVYVAQWPAFYADWDPYRALRNFCCEWVSCRVADRVLVLSDGSQYQYMIRRLFRSDKFVRLSNCLDLTELPSEVSARTLRSSLGPDPTVCHIASVGRLDSQKRVDWLLRSWRQVQDSGANAHLWIAGDGEEAGALRGLAGHLQIGDSCTFLGPHTEGMLLMLASDAVVMTTLFEAQAMVPLEAMACGRPIVANAVDGVAGTFSDGCEGYLVPPADTDGMAQRLLELIRDPALRARMGARGRERVKEFDFQVVMSRYAALYGELISHKGRTTRPSWEAGLSKMSD